MGRGFGSVTKGKKELRRPRGLIIGRVAKDESGLDKKFVIVAIEGIEGELFGDGKGRREELRSARR